METPFEGATTRSRSQNLDATQTVRSSTDPELRPSEDRWVADSQVQEAQLEPSRPTRAAADLLEQLEEGRRAVALLERRVREARERKRLAVESCIAELETQERRKKALERELHELLQHEGGDSKGKETSPHGDDVASVGTASTADRLRKQRKTPRLRDLPTFNRKNIGEAQAFIAGADCRLRMDARACYPTD
ncbi:hypothetical protein V498_00154 [Pseudogymnoascus sp. VKM F-4517 (FW-2822)]|nr:hypothetical protein V498_00154 [Pseudogymnoascus sp. VKM F-4517 (FW-2822)]